MCAQHRARAEARNHARRTRKESRTHSRTRCRHPALLRFGGPSLTTAAIAALNFPISSNVPTVTRMCCGHSGHRLAFASSTFFAAIAAPTCSPVIPFTDIMKKFDTAD